MLTPLLLVLIVDAVVDDAVVVDAAVVDEVNSMTNSSSSPFTSEGSTAGVTGTGVTAGMVAGVMLSLLLSLPAVVVVETGLVVSVEDDVDDVVDDDAVTERRGVMFAQLGNDEVITTAAAAPSLLVMTVDAAEAETGRGMLSRGGMGPAMTALGLSSTEPGPSNGRSMEGGSASGKVGQVRGC